MNPRPSDAATILVEAAAIIDGVGVDAAPGAVLIEVHPSRIPSATVLAAGHPSDLRRHEAARHALLIQRPAAVLIPGLVNAHTHLDLTQLGPRPFDPAGGFVSWIDMVRRERPRDDAGIAAAVAVGLDSSLRGGVVTIGDIAGALGPKLTTVPWRVMKDRGVLGVSFVEFFGIGAMQAACQAEVARLIEQWPDDGEGSVRLGLQPHAPNTVDRRVYRWVMEHAVRRRWRVATHLAETLEEREFVAQARGAQREFLERLGVWSDAILDEVGHGRHPAEHLRDVLGMHDQIPGPVVVAHVNDAPDEAIHVLATTRTSVAYCPRASAYFGAPQRLGPHRYRDMLAAGVNVCLGTDSVINLPQADVDRAGISVAHEMSLLVRRDGLDARTALAMGTTNGALALGLPAEWFAFTRGRPIVGVVGITGHNDALNVAAGARSLLARCFADIAAVEVLIGPEAVASGPPEPASV